MPGFKKWIASRVDEQSPIGDLAGDILRDSGFPANSTDHDMIRGYLKMKGACSEALEAFEEAYREFQG